MRYLCVSEIQDMRLKMDSNIFWFRFTVMILHSTVKFTFFSVVTAPRQYVAPPAKAADPNPEEIRLNSTLALKKELQLLQVPAG